MDKIKGIYLVTFTTGETKTIIVDHNVVDPHGHPIFLVSETEIIYSWYNIISIKKVSD